MTEITLAAGQMWVPTKGAPRVIQEWSEIGLGYMRPTLSKVVFYPLDIPKFLAWIARTGAKLEG